MTKARVEGAAVALLGGGWSLLAAGLIGCGPEPGTAPQDGGAPLPASDGGAAVRRVPALRFRDVTEAAGVDFLHESGAFGAKWMPETMGSGCALFDYDGDDDLDLLLVNGKRWPGHEAAGADGAPGAGANGEETDTGDMRAGRANSATTRLYANDGSGRFTDVTEGTGIGVTVCGMGAAVADYDGDSDVDVYLTAVGDNALLRNDGGAFTDVTRRAGVAGAPQGSSALEWSTSAAWLDADGDGWPDLFVANYVRWSPQTDLFTTIDGVHKSYATPQQYDGLRCRLFRNLGDGTFRDISDQAGLGERPGKSLGVAVIDLEDDGRPDVAVANDTEPTFLLHNLGGRFEEIGVSAGVAYDDAGRARAGMGIDAASPDNDRTLALAIGNFSQEPLSLFHQRRADVFVDEAHRRGLAGPTLRTLTFGLLFADTDLDGFEDLVLANGHIEPTVQEVQPEVSHAQRAQLFWNDGAGAFAEVGAAAGGPFAEPLVGRGLAAGDLDGDGDLDFVFTANGGRARIARNDSPTGQGLRVRLRGAPPNTGALGARVTVTAGGVEQRRWVRTGSSYLSQSELTLTFGLGASQRAERVAVRWPDGTAAAFTGLAAGATYTIEQGGGAPVRVPFAEKLLED